MFHPEVGHPDLEVVPSPCWSTTTVLPAAGCTLIRLLRETLQQEFISTSARRSRELSTRSLYFSTARGSPPTWSLSPPRKIRCSPSMHRAAPSFGSEY